MRSLFELGVKQGELRQILRYRPLCPFDLCVEGPCCNALLQPASDLLLPSSQSYEINVVRGTSSSGTWLIGTSKKSCSNALPTRPGYTAPHAGQPYDSQNERPYSGHGSNHPGLVSHRCTGLLKFFIFAASTNFLVISRSPLQMLPHQTGRAASSL